MKPKGIATIFFSALLCASLSGCLSLQFGSKTHHCNGHPEAIARIAQMERRINTLEHYAGVTPSQQTETLASAKIEVPTSPRTHGAPFVAVTPLRSPGQ